MPPAREKSIEVTAEDAAWVAGRSSVSSPRSASGDGSRSHSTSSSVAKKLTKFIKPISNSMNLHLRSSPKVNKSSPTTPHRHQQQQQQQQAPNNYASDFSSRPYYYAAAVDGGDNSSLNNDSISQMSVAQTVASLDTVKISNRHALVNNCAEDGGGSNKGNHHNHNKKTPWKKLKQFMTSGPAAAAAARKGESREHHNNMVTTTTNTSSGAVVELPHDHGPLTTMRRAHSKSVDFKPALTTLATTLSLTRRRTASTDFPKATLKQQQLTQLQEKSILDDAVRCRLDGMDLLYLGPAYHISLERQGGGLHGSPYNNNNNKSSPPAESSTPWEPAPAYSFAGRSTHYSTRQMVHDMMWRPSAGGQNAAPEIVLEGFFRDDRWIVTLDMPRKGSATSRSSLQLVEDATTNKGRGGGDNPDSIPLLQLTDEEEQSHSTTAPDEIPRHKLWGSMWGVDNKPPPKPSHMSSVEDIEESDSILEMAASCSVPIDIDEDTFMISNFQHLQSVHDLAAVPLQHGRFDETLEIFKRILKGVQIGEVQELRHLEGVTLHNMAVILMWQQKYEEALDCVGKAIKARLQYLPENHPDIAVSLARQGYTYFALERYALAAASFEAASDMFKENTVAKAKAMLNLGVAKYQSGDDVGALKDFTKALEIQRLWLQGPVKREANVLGAAVMLGNMGKVHIKRGDYDLAISVYEEALLLQTSIFRKDHEIVLGTLVSLALAWAFNAQPQKAGQILNGVLRSQLGRSGPGTLEVVETTGVIGNLHFGLGNYEDALKCFTPVVKWQKANLAADHPALQKTKDIMKMIKKCVTTVWV